MRKIEEEFIKSKVKKAKVVVLHGVTGIGKTWLARAYGRQQLNHSSKVYYIDCRPPRTLVENYRQLALAKELPEDLGSDPVERVKNYFSKCPNALLILDNIGFRNELSYKPPDSSPISMIPDYGNPPRVLITSQSSRLGYGKINVKGFDPDEALQLLKSIINQSDQEDETASDENLQKLAKELCYHPWLISMTGHYIREKIIESPVESADEIVEEELDPQAEPRAVIKILEERFSKSLEKAKRKSSNIEDYLTICAYLSLGKIPCCWFDSDEALGALNTMVAFNFCLIMKKGKKEGYFSINDFIQKLIVETDDSKREENLKRAAKWLIEKAKSNPLSINEDYAQHAVQICERAKEGNFPSLAEELLGLGDLLYERKDFSAARNLYAEVLRYVLPLNEFKARLLLKQGSICSDLEDYKEAWACLESGLIICDEVSCDEIKEEILRKQREINLKLSPEQPRLPGSFRRAYRENLQNIGHREILL